MTVCKPLQKGQHAQATPLTEAAPSADKKSLFKEKSTIIVCMCLKMLLDTS
jgi:hypothetical protein